MFQTSELNLNTVENRSTNYAGLEDDLLPGVLTNLFLSKLMQCIVVFVVI